MFRLPNLAADQNVGTAFDHETDAATMLVLVVQPMRGQVINKHRAGPLGRHPNVGAAARRMNSRVGHSQGRLVIHQNIGRSLYRGTDRRVRTAGASVHIHRHLGLVANPGLRLHSFNIVTQLAEIQ